MAIAFQRGQLDKRVHVLGDLYALVGQLAFSGSYATGGDTVGLQAAVREAGGVGRIVAVLTSARGHEMEFDNATGKLKLYSSANTEHTAAAYNAALTASPVPVVILAR